MLAEKVEELGLGGEAFNFGTEEHLTVLEVDDHILGGLGRSDLDPTILNEASLEIREQYLDCSKARERLGWKASYTFDEGLDRCIPWYRAQLGLESSDPRKGDC